MVKALVLVGFLCGLSGCVLTNPNGFESYASVGMRAVHEHRESSSTVAPKCAGLRAWVMGCPEPVDAEIK